MSTDTALVVIDAQIGVVGEAYHHDEVLSNITLLLDRARTSGTSVIYVQHMNPKEARWSQGHRSGLFTRPLRRAMGSRSSRKHPSIPFMRRVCRRSWRRAASHAWSSPGARRSIVSIPPSAELWLPAT